VITQLDQVPDTRSSQPRGAHLALCGEELQPVPPDSEHDGWVCAEPAGHVPDTDHRAEDGTTW
jgi:hypothetical protein